MDRKALNKHVETTHIRLRDREIQDLEAKKKREGLTEKEQAKLDRALRLRGRT